MAVAHVVARRSLCSRAQVGAVIVSLDGIVISTGRNGPPRMYPHLGQFCDAWCQRVIQPSPGFSPDYSDCPSLHAEANALLTSERSQRVGGTIYVTTEVCFGCAKLIANSGLHGVVVNSDPNAYVQRNAKMSYGLLTQCGLKVRFLGE